MTIEKMLTQQVREAVKACYGVECGDFFCLLDRGVE